MISSPTFMWVTPSMFTIRLLKVIRNASKFFKVYYIGRKGRGVNETITVRRIVANEGVERIFPLHSPRIAQIEIVRQGDAQTCKIVLTAKPGR